MDNKVFTGLDIGSNKVKVTVGMPNPSGKLTLLAATEAPSEGVVRSNITNIDKTVNAINEAINQASQEASVDITSVNVSIAGRQTKSVLHRNSISRESADGEITEEDMARLKKDTYRIVTPPGHEIIDTVPKEYAVDYEEGIHSPIGMSGVRLEGIFHVITAQVNVINNIYKCTKKAGLKVDNLIFSPLAASFSVLTEEEKEAGVCLVDIGKSMMGVTIFHGGSLQHALALPFAGESITKDLAHAFMLREAQAEALKVNFGMAYEDETRNEIMAVPGLRNRPEKEIFLSISDRVIEARVEEHIQFVLQEIIRAGFQNKLPGGIVLTGGGALLYVLDKFFSYRTGYDTRVGYPYEFLHTTEGELPGIEYAAAIGLVLAGYRSLGIPEKYYTGSLAEEPVKKMDKKKKKKGFWFF